MTSVLVFFLRSAIVLAVVASSFAHLGNPYRFIGEIAHYGITPPTMTIFLAAILPILQLVLGAVMCLKGTSCVSSGMMAALFFVYAIAQATVIFRGKQIGCGCFGESSMEVGGATISFTLFLMLASIMVCFSDSKGTSSVQCPPM